MKRILPVFVALCCAFSVTAYAQVAARPYALTERGPHHRVLEAPDARLGAPPHRIVELGTGMHYWDDQDKAWKPSEPVFGATAEGFFATRVQHAALISPEINVRGAVSLKTPGGILLQSTPLCIALYDTASGAFQVVSTITNSQGILLTNRNQVWFPSAFAGVCADLVYTISQDAFEQDLLLTAKLDPFDWGLPRATTVIQIWTEFYQPDQPDVLREPRYIEQDAARRRAMASPDVIDETLTWDELRFGLGRAYTSPSITDTNGTWVPVVKGYRTVNQRQFLVESVPFVAIADAVRALPDCVPSGSEGAMFKKDRTRGYALLPPTPPAQAKVSRPSGAPRLAQASFGPRVGVRIDYRATVTSLTTVLQSDTTYLVSSYTVTSLKIEGGAVAKYRTFSSGLFISGSLTCTTSANRPAIFTCVDDDSVGETMNGYYGANYTGRIDPSGYASPALAVPTGSTVSHCRFSYAKTAVVNSAFDLTYSINVQHAQFVNCVKGISLSSTANGSGQYTPTGATVTLDNVLMSNVRTNFLLPSSIVSGGYALAHATIHQSDRIYSGPAIGLGSYNSIFANITNTSTGLSCSGTNNGFYSSATSFGTAPLTVYTWPFQTVGAGNYYLTDASGFRNYGTTTGPPAWLLADIKKRTTYPPIVVAGAIWNSSQALFPQAQRDADLPDIGWHYAPLDYALGWVLATNCTVSVSNGAVIGTFATNTAAGGTYGLGIGQGAALQSFGTPNSPNWFVQYNLIQEQTITNWVQTTGGQLTSEFQGLTPAPVINCRFTQFSIPAQPGPHFNAPTNSGPFNFTDCEFHGGKLLSARPTINLTNCLLDRVYTDLEPKDSPTTTYMRNCLVFGGAFTFAPTNSFVQENLFDKTAITNWNGYSGTNAYITGSQRLQPTRPDDKILSASPVYQSGPLGDFYLLSSSTLINAGFGGTTADQVGLYHYTVTTNIVSGYQIKETNSIVDISYHYVATDTNGVPIDTDGDGLPDYLEDVNGDGSATGDPTSWLNSENGTTGVNGLQVFTPWK